MFNPMDQTRPLIAVLDDEPQMCKALRRLLKTHGFEVVTFAGGAELLAACASRLPNCLLLDLHMPDLNGFEVLERLAAQHLLVPVVVITGHDQLGYAERVRALGGVDYLLKPLNEAQLLAAIGKALETVEQKQPTTQLRPSSQGDGPGNHSNSKRA
jgi:FixJ family two-component response regulator